MSKYTTEVRFICETLAEFDTSQGYGKVSDVLNASWDKVFDFDFPIFDEDYRSVLCKKILKHYYTREIGVETVGLWKLKLDTKMNEIMPIFNKRYESTLFEFNPLYDVDYTRTTNGGESGENESERSGSRTEGGNETDKLTGTDTKATTGTVGVVRSNTGSGSSEDKFSDTPQGSLTNVKNGTYLTNARFIDTSNTENGQDTTTYNTTDTITHNTQNQKTKSGQMSDSGTESGSFSTTKEYVERVVGKMGNRTYASVINEFRDAIINVDMEIIEALSDLFMKVW